ncbi:unnamed protein product [Hermetia illucens]|uniref:Fatty acyl-CoA reductase C-terminal domain-containing protein n=1 Tax=Hermetia illucens TaxID=343691 RepID=A0A7R8UD27_HERIL|nr:unnamed protein product [Hermetia illucens]
MPAILFDALIKFSGRKPFLLYIQRRALATQMSYGFFLWNEYIFNSRLLHSTGGFKQNEDFRVDITYAQSLDRFARTTVLGCRRYILREGDNTIPQSIRRVKM